MKNLIWLFFISSSFAQVDFTHLQWAHENKGEVIRLRRNFHEIEDVKSKKGFDTKLNELLTTKFKNQKDVVVAVIDSGVSFQHPDLKDNIFRNTKECDENGDPLFLVNEDRDKNGYPGDCIGWNFASLNDKEIRDLLETPQFQRMSEEAKKSISDELKQARRLPYDIDGHGTHIAGILAAKRSNSSGLNGISDHIKILPIKVYDNPNALAGRFVNIVSGQITQRKPLATVVTEAIQYAIRMKVDVINMSIGWNKISMSSRLEKVIQDALRRNIVIVTSSDNSGSNDSTFPCRLLGVICVGSTDPYGNLSQMSNYGHNVDILAPGDKILSLYPQSLDPLEFSVAGFEYLSGTSQATPFISGAVAILKSVDPSMNLADIKRTLYNATNPVPNDKEVTASLSGMINYSKLFAQKDPQVVFPNFKRMQSFQFKPKEKTISGVIAIENLSRKDIKKKVTVKSLTPQYKFEYSKEMDLRALGIIDIPVELSATELSKAPDTVVLEISFDDKKYTAEYPLLYNLDLSLLSQKTISAKDSALIRASAESKLRPILNFKERDEEYYTVTIKQKVGLEVTIFEEKENTLKSKKSILLEMSNKISSVMKVDLNGDSIEDYLVFSIHRIVDPKNPDKSETYWQYSYYDNKLNPLFGNRSKFKYVPTRATFPNEYNTNFDDLLFTLPRNPKDIGFVTQNVSGLGKIAFPVFFSGYSFVPVHQQQTSAFAKLDVRAEDQIFHLKLERKDGKDYLVTYSLLDKAFYKKLTGRSYKLKGLRVVGPLKETSQCARGKCSKFLVLSGRSYYKKVSMLTLGEDFKYSIEDVEGEVWDLGNFAKREVFATDFKNFSKHDYVQVTSQDSLTQYSFENGSLAALETQLDKYSSYYPIASFETPETKLDIYFENYSLSFFDKINQNWTTVPWKFYSFISAKNQSFLYESTYFMNDGKLEPALLWNAQALTEDSYRLAIFKDGKVFKPLTHAFRIPRGCQRLTNRFNADSKFFEIPLVCGQAGSKALSVYTFPLKN